MSLAPPQRRSVSTGVACWPPRCGWRATSTSQEATADAFLLALQTWPDNGIPASVEAWLLTVARRKAVDRIRRAATLRERLTEMAATEVTVIEGPERQLAESVLTDDELLCTWLVHSPGLGPKIGRMRACSAFSC